MMATSTSDYNCCCDNASSTLINKKESHNNKYITVTIHRSRRYSNDAFFQLFCLFCCWDGLAAVLQPLLPFAHNWLENEILEMIHFNGQWPSKNAPFLHYYTKGHLNLYLKLSCIEIEVVIPCHSCICTSIIGIIFLIVCRRSCQLHNRDREECS